MPISAASGKTAAMARARILVIEDDNAIRTALDAALCAEDYEVRTQPDGWKAEQVAESFRPDLVILDVRMPVGPDGFTICRRLRQMGDLPTLFVTAADSLDDRLVGFEAGGDDYLVKPFETRELLARVGALLRRSGRLAPTILRVADLVVDTEAGAASRGDTKLGLTHTEYELLVALARHPGRVLSKVQLLTMVWGYESSMDVNLVEVHVSSLRRKLEAVGPRLIQTVRGTGYVIRG